MSPSTRKKRGRPPLHPSGRGEKVYLLVHAPEREVLDKIKSACGCSRDCDAARRAIHLAAESVAIKGCLMDRIYHLEAQLAERNEAIAKIESLLRSVE